MQSVNFSYDPSVVKTDEQMKPLMGKTIKGLATEEEKKIFQTLWQERVEEILLDTDLHRKLITITKD